MATTQQRPAVPDGFGSPQTKLVYLALRTTEASTVSELQQLLGLSKLTLLPILSSLVENDLARRTEGGYVSR
nr:MarR family transcriptional regulator [Natronococcus pandeyae]